MRIMIQSRAVSPSFNSPTQARTTNRYEMSNNLLLMSKGLNRIEPGRFDRGKHAEEDADGAGKPK